MLMTKSLFSRMLTKVSLRVSPSERGCRLIDSIGGERPTTGEKEMGGRVPVAGGGWGGGPAGRGRRGGWGGVGRWGLSLGGSPGGGRGAARCRSGVCSWTWG